MVLKHYLAWSISPQELALPASVLVHFESVILLLHTDQRLRSGAEVKPIGRDAVNHASPTGAFLSISFSNIWLADAERQL